MSRYPVSLVCPSCGSSRFKKLHDDHAATLRFLRECKDCGQRYEPPVPRWAAVCAIVVGILLAIGGVVSAFLFSGGFGQVAGVMIGISLCGVTVIVLAAKQLAKTGGGGEGNEPDA